VASPKFHVHANEAYQGYSEANPTLVDDIFSRSRDSKGVGKVAETATAKTDDMDTHMRIKVVARRKPARPQPAQLSLGRLEIWPKAMYFIRSIKTSPRPPR